MGQHAPNTANGRKLQVELVRSFVVDRAIPRVAGVDRRFVVGVVLSFLASVVVALLILLPCPAVACRQ